jgi:hypothetical protein
VFCDREYRRIRYAQDPEYRERRLAYSRAWAAAHRAQINQRLRRKRADVEYRDSLYDRRYKSQYGISMDEYKAMLARQGGVCAICRQQSARALSVDHCHTTGKVRGLLCQTCNSGLGSYRDDPSLTRAATAYLEASLADEEA